ncbi:MAG TPA: ABC transporter permease subunit [Myxococcota bacterium]|nr:ABC transporter permease subunit [Myxococcota bacterium]
MRHVPTVAMRELRSLFVSPVGYVVLALFCVLAGFFFVIGVAAFDTWVRQLMQFQAFDQLQELNLNDQLVSNFYDTMSVILLFLTPAITMGLFAAEKTNGTQELLLTSPLTMWDIVLGKYLGAALFVTLLVLLVGAFPALLFAYGDPEVGKTASGLMGLLLVGWTYTALGCFASSLTRSQIVSFLIALVMLLPMLLLPAISDLNVIGEAEGVGRALRWLATGVHLQPLLQGMVDTADLAYFAVIIGTMLLLTKASVESVRWR